MEAAPPGVLTVIGDLVEDIVVWTDAVVRRGTDNPATVHRTRGGSAANVAAMAAGLVPSRFVGRVGDDAAGAALVAGLEGLGVDVRVERAGRTGTVVVLVDGDGERTMFPDRGAAAELDRIPDEWLRSTAVVHVPAYGLISEPMASTLRTALGALRRSGAVLSIDVSAASLIEAFGPGRFRALLDSIAPDVLFANADEAAALDLRSRPPGGVVVVKRGADPALVRAATGGPGHGSSSEPEWVEVPAVAVAAARDTTGAGDAFAAGFLASWMAAPDAVVACVAGHRRAAAILATPGAT